MLTPLKQHGTVGTCVICLFGLSLIAGVILSPHCSNGMWEVLADQESYFTCMAEGPVYWTLRLNDDSTISIASCDKHCSLFNGYDGLFSASTIDLHKSTVIINAQNNRKVYDNVQLVNGSLECSRWDQDTTSAAYGLNFVYLPHGVSCTTLNSLWFIKVSCIINTIYSSRNVYTCSLIRTQTLRNETQETVTMVTSPTSEKISRKEAKVSGTCHFSTRLPSEEGKYGFLVSVSPGGQTFMTEDKKFTVARPKSPRISCGPQTHVLQNTTVTCTCSTPSLGQPAGSLRLVIGNKTTQQTAAGQEKQEISSRELLYSHVLTLSDHSSTWFRCDLLWGTEEIRGQNYTASVGYAPKKLRFSMDGLDGNRTVKEKDQVSFQCKSDGRPSPNVSIYNNDNDTVIIRDSSPVIYTFIARCEDTATYTCSAWNEFSSQSGVTTSYSLNIDVSCKPRCLSSTPLKMVRFRNKIQANELRFEVIAYPVPHKYDVWFIQLVTNNSELYPEKSEGSDLNVTCKSSGKHRYLWNCTLTVFSVLPQSDGVYKVRVANEHGEENFTVEISYAANEDLELFNQAVIYVVVSLVVFIFAIVLLIAVIRKVNKNKGDQPSDDPEVIYETPWDNVPLTMQPLKVNVTAGSPLPEPCQMRLYAVVDTTRKKTNSRSAETKRSSAQDTHSNSEYANSDTEYAVLDKFRGRALATRDNDHKDKKSSSRAMRGLKADGSDVSTYDHLVLQPLPPRQNDSAKWQMPCSASHSHTVDDGRWANDDGLIYVTPVFDVTKDARHRPAPMHEKTEYITPREIGKFKLSQKKSDR